MNNTESMAAAGVQISYNVTFPEAQAHYVDIEMNLSGLTKDVDLKMPVWTPGSYLVREFAKNVEGFNAATASGKALAAVKTRKNTWHISTGGASAISVKYRVYCFEISVRTAFVDASHGFLSTSGIFMYPAGMLHNPSTIHIKPFEGWTKVSTSLPMVGDDPFVRRASDYDILFDSPIEVGNQDVFSFEAAGVNYDVAMYGGGNYDKERLKKDMAKIVEQETAVYGENPNKYYVFIVHNYKQGGGGLEHLSSTVLGMSRDGYATERGYQGFMSLVAHEHFHLWNVKRLRPIVLGPFDYDNENYTTDLWIAEGFTAYYQDIILRHAGLIAPENYLDVLAGTINLLQNSPGHKVQALSESSYDAWIKAYRPNENSNNTTISYYTKGALVGALLDLEIIKDSNGKYSLDDVMHHMYQTYYKGLHRGYTDAEFKAGLEKFAGKNLDAFYKNYVNGLTELDYGHYLGYAGYKLTDELAGASVPALGVSTSLNNGKLIVTSIMRDGSTWLSGLSVNDEIESIDSTPVTDLGALLGTKKVGDQITLNILRDGKKMDIPVTLKARTAVKYHIESVATPDAGQLAVRKKWLKL